MVVPLRVPLAVRYQSHDSEMLVSVSVVGLVIAPVGTGGRHGAAAVGADELALGDDVGEAQPDGGAASGNYGASVLLVRAGHGQVGAQRGALALRFNVVGKQVQSLQTAAGTAAEAGRTGAGIGCVTCKILE